jgi:hypothetical protein
MNHAEAHQSAKHSQLIHSFIRDSKKIESKQRGEYGNKWDEYLLP